MSHWTGRGLVSPPPPPSHSAQADGQHCGPKGATSRVPVEGSGMLGTGHRARQRQQLWADSLLWHGDQTPLGLLENSVGGSGRDVKQGLIWWAVGARSKHELTMDSTLPCLHHFYSVWDITSKASASLKKKKKTERNSSCFSESGTQWSITHIIAS